MNIISILNPAKLVFGSGSLEKCIADLGVNQYIRIFLITFPEILPSIGQFLDKLPKNGKQLMYDVSITCEPTDGMAQKVLNKANDFNADCVIGIGGGSVLDVAKITAALLGSEQKIEDVYGIGRLNSRSVQLICLPTTSGTGSEMSPNAILLDQMDSQKKGIISPCLVPDATYIDPLLTISVPPPVTASTGMDALIHCIEAYTNKFSHPVVDNFALEGIRLIGRSLYKAYQDGNDITARTDLAMGSMYGGMCLGPVNTAAIHALSYPLGSKYKIAHGLSNALLLPHVMRFNLPSVKDKYADIAIALGVEKKGNSTAIAQKGIDKIIEMIKTCNIPVSISSLKIPEEELEGIAKSALKVKRLLVNNPRKITLEEAISIYKTAY